MCLEGNPIEQDIYYKVKLLNCVPNLKTLDGATVWRRTSLQSRIVNDDLKYTDLCARTPASVDKYAQLSRRNIIHQNNSSILNHLNGSMLTLQAVGSHHKTDRSAQPLPEHSRLPLDLRNMSTLESPGRSYSSKKLPKRTAEPAPQQMVSELSDISLLPAHLQETLRQQHQRINTSPRRVGCERSFNGLRSSGNASTTAVWGGGGSTSVGGNTSKSVAAVGSPDATVNGSASSSVGQTEKPRSRSALPWRNPPSVAPNYNTRVLSRRSGKSGDDVSTVFSTNSTPRGPKPPTHKQSNGEKQHVVPGAQSQQRSGDHTPAPGHGSNEKNKTAEASTDAGVRLRGRSAEPRAKSPAAKVSTDRVSPTRKSSGKETNQAGVAAVDQSTDSTQWMNPHLNLALTAKQTPGKYRYQPQPGSPSFDHALMESTNSSTLFILQQSFDADRRSSSDLNSLRGRSRTRTERAPSSARSVATSASPSGTRSVTQTVTSIGRASFSAEMLRAQQEAERAARELVEARTYSRPPTPSRSPYPTFDNGNYAVFNGTSPLRRQFGEDHPYQQGNGNEANFSPPASVYRALSPQRLTRHDSFGSRSVSAPLASPSRLASVDRILQAYGVDPLPQQETPVMRVSSRATVQGAANSSSHGFSEESKLSHPSDPQGSPVAAGRDESPYRRFLKLRERLSNKYAGPSDAPVSTNKGTAAPPQVGTGGEAVEKRPVKGHTYDFVRKMDVESMDPALNQDFGEIESKIVELQQQDIQFRQLKEQYQQQYQQEYEKELQDRNVAITSSIGASASQQQTVGAQQQAPHPHTQEVAKPRTNVELPPPPPTPVGAGYDVLYDLIHRRRSVLEKITQPHELSPERVRPPPSADKQDISNAINGLKHRQEASVNVVQSMTRERVVPLPVRDSIAQVTLSTPALHSSINHYMYMSQGSPPGAASPPGQNNSFLARLTTNNPYMQNLSCSMVSSVPVSSGAGPLRAVGQLGQSYAAPQSFGQSYAQAPNPFVPRTSDGSASAPSQSHTASQASVANTSVYSHNNSLAVAIQNLQVKQAKDLISLRKS